MALNLRSLDLKDLDIIAPWYQARGDGVVVDFLPDTGFMVEIDSVPAACGFLLLTNSKVCFMEYLQTDNKLSETKQAKALIFLTKSLEKMAKSLGFSVIIGLVPEDHFSLAEFYKRQNAHFGSKLMRLCYKAL